jgi:thiol-disulfide isomerase/thioredoxin
MKLFFLSIALFLCIHANSQVNDSMQEMETSRLWNESFYENVLRKELPDFTARDLNGKIYTSNTVMNQKVTFMNFWFIACAPCIAEIPNLNRLYDMMKDNPDFHFFAITYEKEAQAKEAIKKYDIRFPVLLVSPNEAQQLTFGRGYPTNMVLDKEGKIYSILSGGSLKPGPELELYWKQEIEKLLNGDSLIEKTKPVNWNQAIEKLLKADSMIEIPKPVNTPDNKSGIVFIDSTIKIQSLDALTKHFKGKSLFIDLWASWCLPCREDFTSKNSVDSFLNKHKIDRLYISVDNPKAQQVWKTLVYEYQLDGYHLLAGNELIKDLKQNVYRSDAIEIPRYIIVKNGKIVELNAFRPSDDQKLIKQLIEKLF